MTMPASEPVPQAGTTISPKVTWPTVVGVLVTLGTAALTGIASAATPDNLAGLGVWAPVAAAAITTGAAALTGYLKRDPLRDMTPVINPQVYVGDTSPDGVAADPASSDVTAPALDVTGPASADVTAVPDGTGVHRADPA